MNSKKAVGLPINIIVMMIIGLVIFGLGMALFNKLSGGAEAEVDYLADKIKNDISSLQCKGDDWICSPNNQLNNGKTETFELYIANRADTVDKFKVHINNLNSEKRLERKDCGSISISYLEDFEVKIEGGYSASIPYVVRANRVSKTPCSFITSVNLTKDSDPDFVQKTSIIVGIE